MIKVESNMLVLDTTFSKQDAEAINHFVEIANSKERDRIIKLLEPLGECEPSICGKGCRGQHRCIGWAYRHAIRLIKGESK